MYKNLLLVVFFVCLPFFSINLSARGGNWYDRDFYYNGGAPYYYGIENAYPVYYYDYSYPGYSAPWYNYRYPYYDTSFGAGLGYSQGFYFHWY